MAETLTGTVGELVRAKTIVKEDVEKAAATLFDGKTVLSIKGEHGVIMPALKDLSVFHREAIIGALLLAKPAKDK
ncbi:MAG TPA: hypothetical protein VIL65_04190 [Beijerinckiaceae bacterium]|jgi:hypothetical protein